MDGKAPIRILVTCEALARGLDEVINIFEANRAAIEAVAGRKFDADRVDDRTDQGQPIVTRYANDMPNS
jgi:hypothetical protein